MAIELNNKISVTILHFKILSTDFNHFVQAPLCFVFPLRWAQISHNCSEVWFRSGRRLYLRYKKSQESTQSQVTAQCVIAATRLMCIREHSVKIPGWHFDSTNQVQAGELQSSTFIKMISTDSWFLATKEGVMKITCNCSSPCTTGTQVKVFLSLVTGKRNRQICFTSITFISREAPRFITIPGDI